MNTTSIPIKLNHSPTQTIQSHGWVRLSPFDYQPEASLISWASMLPDLGPTVCSAVIDESNSVLNLNVNSRFSDKDCESMVTTARRMFRADENFSDFWDLIANNDSEGLLQVRTSRAGALLRGQSVFEDLVKTLLTVNCAWSNTAKMVSSLCKSFGNQVRDLDAWTFPTPEQLAGASEVKLRSSGLGFRAKFVHQTAVRFASNPDLESDWEAVDVSETLRENLLQIPGVGNYVANHMLVMLGHYSNIPADSTTREFLGIPPKSPRNAADELISKQFRRWGKYAALAYQFTRNGSTPPIPGLNSRT